MSASREKKKRQEIQTEAPVVQETKKGLSKPVKTVLGAVIAIILVAVIVFFAMVTGGFFEKHTTAAVVNGHKFTPGMVNHYYYEAYSSASTYLSYMVDMETPLDEQAYLSEEYDTWADYFMDYGMILASEVYSIYDEAMANGFTLSEEAQTTIDNEIAMLDSYAALYGYSNADAFIAAQYGTGSDVDTYKQYITVSNVAQEYANSIVDTLVYTDEEVDAYYAANPELFDAINYRMFAVDALTETDDEGNEIVTDEAMAAAEEIAKAMAEASKGSEDTYKEQAIANTAEEDLETYDVDANTLYEDVNAENANMYCKDWLFDEAREPGDTTYVLNNTEEEADGYYVLYYIGEADHSFQLPNVRHILISVADTADENAMAEALATAQDLLTAYNENPSEEAFAQLAKDNSADGSAAEGGLIENIAPKQMVEAFDAWCFDENRQIGDTGIVETEYGYHVMYFSGYGKTYHENLVYNAMLIEDYTEWETSLTDNATYTINSIRYVNTR